MVARALSELRSLQFVMLTTSEQDETGNKLVREGNSSSRLINEGCAKGWKGESATAELMLKAEKRILKNVVGCLYCLKVFQLEGFDDEVLARTLEYLVRGDRYVDPHTPWLGKHIDHVVEKLGRVGSG